MTHDELVEKVARTFHDAYEAAAAVTGWNTQEACQVSFDDLPKANQRTMLVATEAAIAVMREVFESREVTGEAIRERTIIKAAVKAAGMVAE